MSAACIPAHGRMARAALIAAAALAFTPAASANVPPPDFTYPKTFNGVKYRCSQWGSPPKRFIVMCIPEAKKAGAAKGAA